MKKILFTILCAGAVMSCAKEEVITAEQEAITFENAFVDNATKALDGYTVTTGNLTTFNVWGTTQMPSADGEAAKPIVPIFDEVAVSLNGTAWTYGATFTQYWIPGNAYVFAAAKNYESVGLVDGVPATIVYDATTQKDLIYDEDDTRTGNVADSNPAVEFTFEHLLSKAYFTVKNEMSTANPLYSYKVSNIAINNAVKKATYTVATEKWADVTASYTTTEPLDFGNVNGVATATTEAAVKILANTANNTSHYSRLLIPAEYKDANKLNITCTIETLYGDAAIDVENYSRDIVYTFEKGHAYNFIFTLKNPGDEIKFDVTAVKGWVEGDRNLPNMENQQNNQ